MFIEHKLLYMTEGEVPDEEYLVPLGSADIKRSGTDVTVVTYSLMTLRCLEAAQRLADEGISVEVVDLRTLSPMDMPAVLASVRKTHRLVVVHEAIRRGGIGGDIAATVAEQAFDSLAGPIVRVAGQNTTIPFNMGLQRAAIPSVDDIVTGIRTAAQGRAADVH